MTNEREALKTWLQLLAAAKAIKKSVDARLREQFGVSVSRFDVLAALERAGPKGLRAGALSQWLMVTDGNITQVTAALIREGLVQRMTSRKDGRVAIFRLTRKGERLFDEMARAHRRWVLDAFANMSEPQLLSLRRLLGRLDLPLDAPGARKDAA